MILTRCLLTILGILALRSEGTECISRIRRQAQELELNEASCDVADVDADRPARCIPLLSPFRRFKNRLDGDLIAKYFSGGSLLGSPSPQTGESKTGTGDAAENAGSSSTDSIVGASNSFDGTNSMTGKFMANPLLHPTAAAAYMTPYSYVVGAPNPIYALDRSNGAPMQPYSYSYDIGGNYLGSSPYWNYQPSAGAPNTLELPKSSISDDKGMDESSQSAGNVIGQPKPDPNLGLEQDTDVDSKTKSKNTKNADYSSVIGGKQVVNQQEDKD